MIKFKNKINLKSCNRCLYNTNPMDDEVSCNYDFNTHKRGLVNYIAYNNKNGFILCSDFKIRGIPLKNEHLLFIFDEEIEVNFGN